MISINLYIIFFNQSRRNSIISFITHIQYVCLQMQTSKDGRAKSKQRWNKPNRNPGVDLKNAGPGSAATVWTRLKVYNVNLDWFAFQCSGQDTPMALLLTAKKIKTISSE